MGKYHSPTVKKWLRLYGISNYSPTRKTVDYFKRIKPIYNFEEIVAPIKGHKDYPIKLGMHFVRGTRHMWDFNNATHVILDLMTAMEIIPDDSVKYMLPFPLEIDGEYWKYDKENPGVYITIL